jgi:alcohol dehydrogenase-like protein
MGTMMALRAHARGGPEQLVYEQAPEPSAGPGEVLIAVHAAAITFAELTWDLEWTTRDGKDRTPVIPSHEMSGIVAGLGAGVAGLAAGDEVIGLIDFDRDGAAAEYVVMPGVNLAAMPQSLSHVAAATLPLAALTAWQALADHAALQPPASRCWSRGGRRNRHIRRPARGDPRRPRHRHRPQRRRRLRTGPRRGALHQRRGRASQPGGGRVRCRHRHSRRYRA